VCTGTNLGMMAGVLRDRLPGRQRWAYHRQLHPIKSFKAQTWLARGAGPSPARWRSRGFGSSAGVSDHRRHHAFSDKEGDPHSPWNIRHLADRGGQGASSTRTSAGCFDRGETNEHRFAPGTCSADRAIMRVKQELPLGWWWPAWCCRRSSADWSPGPGGGAAGPDSYGAGLVPDGRAAPRPPGRSTRSAT